jgi:hypothetical protein
MSSSVQHLRLRSVGFTLPWHADAGSSGCIQSSSSYERDKRGPSQRGYKRGILQCPHGLRNLDADRNPRSIRYTAGRRAVDDANEALPSPTNRAIHREMPCRHIGCLYCAATSEQSFRPSPTPRTLVVIATPAGPCSVDNTANRQAVDDANEALPCHTNESSQNAGSCRRTACVYSAATSEQSYKPCPASETSMGTVTLGPLGTRGTGRL